jgi:hypothetical protein
MATFLIVVQAGMFAMFAGLKQSYYQSAGYNSKRNASGYFQNEHHFGTNLETVARRS